MFKLQKVNNKARKGILQTKTGKIRTPFFMPIATKGAIKTLDFTEIEKLKPEIILSNTYHLMLRPGQENIKKLGGLHQFMHWPKPILTDSGGFQVFSLAKMRKISEDGVKFSSHIDGRKFFLTPESAIDIQMAIDSDIMMVLDECVELPCNKKYLAKSVDLTARWAQRCKKYFDKKNKLQKKLKPILFGIVQGGLDKELRLKSAQQLKKLNFDGYAIGGLSVGENEKQLMTVLDYLADELPNDKPRYLMGVGYPNQILQAVKKGIDMFDCVIPTREARHGRLYLWDEKFLKSKKNILNLKDNSSFYNTINIFNSKFVLDKTPINKHSQQKTLQTYSRAYLRQLFKNEDPLAQKLASLNNIEFYLKLMRMIRKEI